MANRRRRRKRTNDAYTNSAARLGFGTTDLTQASQYTLTRLTNDQYTLTALYRDNWIVQNIVQIVPQDIMRKGFEIKSAEHNADNITRLLRKTQLENKLEEGLCWGRLYGGAAGIILIKGHDDLSVPLDLRTVLPGSFAGLYILDRWTGVFPNIKVVENMSDPDFGLPESYSVQINNDLFVNVHHTRLVRFDGRTLPTLEKIENMYWGESEIEAIYHEIVRRDSTAENITALTFKANMEYRGVESLDQLLAMGNTKMQQAFWETMAAQAAIRSSQGISLYNKGDEVKTETYTFAGLADVYDRVMMDVAGAARIPVTKLFGRSAAGMNSTGENDVKNYYDYIDGVRESYLRPILEKLLPIICMSAWGEIPQDADIEFPPLETPDEEKVAEITAKKVESVIAAWQSNLIDKSTALKELRDIDGIFDKLTDEQTNTGEGVYFTQEQALRDPFMGA